MPDPQPSRPSAPATRLLESRPPLHNSGITGWLHSWWPAVVWACVIFTLSTDSFSSSHTYTIIGSVLHWLFPGMSADSIKLVNYMSRKTAHFSEYFIFCLFVFRGIRGARIGWRWIWGFSAWFVAAGYSCLDELHQAFVASRTASPYDSLLDSIGAFFAVLALAVWFYFRRPKTPALTQNEAEVRASAL